MPLEWKPKPGDTIRIGDRIKIRTIKRRRGRRTEVVHLIDGGDLRVRLDKSKRKP